MFGKNMVSSVDIPGELPVDYFSGEKCIRGGIR
jgi:hypothetical protein